MEWNFLDEVNDLNTSMQQLAGDGTSTSALAFGGNIPPSPSTTLIATESWNGSSWTELNDLNSGRYGYLAAAGNVSLALAFGGGGANAPASYAQTESWDGTSWTWNGTSWMKLTICLQQEVN